MRKTTKNTLALLASAGVLVACVKSQWMVKYQDSDPYFSYGNATAVDTMGNAFLGGFLESRDAGQNGRVSFVAKYDANGKLIWDYRFTESPDAPYRGINQLLTDDSNNLYVLEARDSPEFDSMGVLITKFSAAGNVLWQQYVNTQPFFYFHLNAKMRSDGNLHVMMQGLDLLTLSPDGALIWSYQPDPLPPPDHGELPPYGGRYPAKALDAGYNARNLGTELQLINALGETLASFNPSQLDLKGILHALTHGNVTVVLGDSGGGLAARRIVATDAGFTVDSENNLELPYSMASFNNVTGGFCYAAIDSGKLTTGYVDANLIHHWQHSVAAGTGANWVELIKVVAATDKCYTQYMSYAPQDARTTVIVEDIVPGKEYEPITVQHFGGSDFTAKGMVILQAGITGPYTTDDGTAATLIKHTIK